MFTTECTLTTSDPSISGHWVFKLPDWEALVLYTRGVALVTAGMADHMEDVLKKHKPAASGPPLKLVQLKTVTTEDGKPAGVPPFAHDPAVWNDSMDAESAKHLKSLIEKHCKPGSPLGKFRQP